MTDHFKTVTNWIDDAGQKPSDTQLSKYLGYMLSEVCEVCECFNDPFIRQLAYDLEQASVRFRQLEIDMNVPRELLLDGIGDTIWTAIGAGHMLADIHCAFGEVGASNDSKRVDGKLIVDSTGKVLKGPNFREPSLSRYLR